MDPRELRLLDSAAVKQRIDECDRRLKELSPELAQHEARATALRAEVSRQSQHLNTLRNEIERRNRPAPVPRISDHAMLRYIERVHGVNLEALRAHILTARIVAAIQSGASAVICDGVRMVVRENVIVTIVENENRTPTDMSDSRRALPAREAIAAGIDEYESSRQSA